MLTALSRRPAQLGPTINDRTEKHGNEDKPALDITVTGFVVTREEFNALAGHPGAYDGLVDHSSNPPRWAYPNLVPQVSLVETLKGCSVLMLLGLENFELNLTDVNIKGGIVAFDKGIAALAFKIQHEGELSGEQLLKLRAAKNKTIDIAITFGAADGVNDAQGNLALGEGGQQQTDTARPKRRKKGDDAPPAAGPLDGATWNEQAQRFEGPDGQPIDGTVAGRQANGAAAAH